MYLPDLEDALRSQMHAKHRLGCAGRKTGYTYYESLLPHAHKGISNACWNMPCISTQTKRTIFSYQKGTLMLVNLISAQVLTHHNLQIPAHSSNRVIPPYLFPRDFPKRSRLTSSRPDAILNTPYQAKPTSSSPPSS
eukprot:444137-Pelagomonas_calceolata.AAC.1